MIGFIINCHRSRGDKIFIFRTATSAERSLLSERASTWYRILQITTLHGTTFCWRIFFSCFACRPNNQIHISSVARHMLLHRSVKKLWSPLVASIKTIFLSGLALRWLKGGKKTIHGTKRSAKTRRIAPQPNCYVPCDNGII